MRTSTKVTAVAMMLCLAVILHMLERLIPLPTGIPGAKLGLANIVTLVAVFILHPRETLAFVLVRVGVTSFLTSGFTAFWFSLSGALLSTAVMYFSVFVLGKYLSFPSVSVLGAISHNAGQLAMAAFILQTGGIIYYLPVLLGAAVFSGLFTGFAAGNILKFMYNKGYIVYPDAYLNLISQKESNFEKSPQ